MHCAYCELPEIKERAIVRTAHSFAFPTFIPIVPGHVLISPLRCVALIEDLDEEELADFFALRLRMKRALTKAFGATDFNYAWNEGKIAGQNVPHLHLHMLPRKAGDTGITKYEPRKFLYRPGEREKTPEVELATIAKMIRAHL